MLQVTEVHKRVGVGMLHAATLTVMLTENPATANRFMDFPIWEQPYTITFLPPGMFFRMDYCTSLRFHSVQYQQTIWLCDVQDKNMPGGKNVIA